MRTVPTPLFRRVIGALALGICFALSNTSVFGAEESDIGVYNGTFDPVHLGHLSVAEAAVQKFHLKTLIIFPNLETEGKNPAPFEQRWRLLKAATAYNPHFFVPDLEFLKKILSRPNGRDEFLEKLSQEHPKNDIYKIMGSDSFESFLQLEASKQFFKKGSNKKMIVVSRLGAALPSGSEELVQNKQLFQVVPAVDMKLSSTAYRADPLLEEGSLPEPVAQEIRKKHLYGRDDERGFYDLPPEFIQLLENEQLHNEKIEDTDHFLSIKKNDLDPKFLPEHRPTFWLYTVDLPESEARILSTVKKPPPQVSYLKDGKRFFKFFIHPESKDFFEKYFGPGVAFKKEFLATPTASYRSLVVWNPKTNDPPMNIKVSLNKSIGERNRNLPLYQLQGATGASAALKTIDPRELEKHHVQFVDEGFSVLPSKYDFGYTYRETPVAAKGAELIPMFSLYSHSIDGPPPILKMIKDSGMSAEKFVAKKIIDPMVDQAVWLGVEHGLAIESHEQNVLMETKDGQPTGRFFYRDLAGFSVNPRLREAKGKDMSFLPKGTDEESVRPDRANVVNGTELFLHRSNFFALRKSLETTYPEISEKWVQEQFENSFKSHLEERTGIKLTSEELGDNASKGDQALQNYALQEIKKRAKTETALDKTPSKIGSKGPIGVYSGTFDPIHLGHLSAAEAALQKFNLETLVIIPNLEPEGKNPIPFEERWRLVKEATAYNPHFYVPDLDILKKYLSQPDGKGKIYQWVREQSHVKELYNLMGSDSYQKFLQMPAGQQFLKHPKDMKIAVVDRLDVSLPPGSQSLVKSGHLIKLSPVVDMRLSSSQYREDPLLGESILPEPVAKEIEQKHLYNRDNERGLYDLPPSVIQTMEYEQLHNERIEDTKNFASINADNELDPKYLPEHRPTFWLYTVDLPESKVRTLSTVESVPPQISYMKDGARYFRFFIHPESKEFFEKYFGKDTEFKQEFLATPTSSHRSLLVWNPKTDDPPFNVKVTLDREIGQSRRLLTLSQIQRATASSALLKTVDPAEFAEHQMKFIDEGFSVLPSQYDFGYSVRSMPEVANGAELIPMFSLYSRSTQGPPPLIEMIEKSGMTPKNFISQKIIAPMVEQAVWLGIEHGIIGEPHEQNVLMETKGGQPTGRFFYRDLAGYSVNPKLRGAKGKDLSYLPEGINKDFLKVDRAKLVESNETYLRGSNLFALRKSLRKKFPEITESWIQKQFEQAMLSQLNERTGLKLTTLENADKEIEAQASREIRKRKLEEEKTSKESLSKAKDVAKSGKACIVRHIQESLN